MTPLERFFYWAQIVAIIAVVLGWCYGCAAGAFL